MLPIILITFAALMLGALKILPMSNFYLGVTLFIFCGMVVTAGLRAIRRYLSHRPYIGTPPLPEHLRVLNRPSAHKLSMRDREWLDGVHTNMTNPGTGLPMNGLFDSAGYAYGEGPDEERKRE